ncbi:MAG: hypothetical protein LBH98_05490 [Chitinispirillales bacterium]|jgi:triacylglycerol lipase|nr:hypothetical protein [Chitinispirillales bacterium]
MSLNYPIVLVHGIIAHDRGKFNIFWGRIPRILKKKGIRVFFGNTDAWGTCDSNAKILKTTIEKILLETKAKKVNIIAHSKGGIDSRYLIWKHNFEDKVASLITINTPHYGSTLSDWICERKIFKYRFTKKSLNIFAKLYGDTNPDLYGVFCQLTTNKMKEFNAHVIMNDKVYFQSLYTTLKNSSDDLLYFFSHRYLKRISGENDGIVSENCAIYGKNAVKIEGSISHSEILDIKRRKISGINIPDIYVKIVEDLVEKGF